MVDLLTIFGLGVFIATYMLDAYFGVLIWKLEAYSKEWLIVTMAYTGLPLLFWTFVLLGALTVTNIETSPLAPLLLLLLVLIGLFQAVSVYLLYRLVRNTLSSRPRTSRTR